MATWRRSRCRDRSRLRSPSRASPRSCSASCPDSRPTAASPSSLVPSASDDVLAAIDAAGGAIRFDQYMRIALYGDHGFYNTGGSAGRRGDFITSPEVGPLFGAVMARALDAWWREAGSPDTFVVVEAGAGVGTLARAVLAADPTCAPALRYVLVERSDRLRAH